jgi:GABA(A) receptor-associated protein
MTSCKEGSFKKEFYSEKRQLESKRIMDKFKDRIPVIVEISRKCNDIRDIDKQKYLVPDELSVGQFQYVIRKRIKLPQSKAMYMIFNNKLCATSESIKKVYEKNKDTEDGFLYTVISTENTFG